MTAVAEVEHPGSPWFDDHAADEYQPLADEAPVEQTTVQPAAETELVAGMLPIRQKYGLTWYVDQPAVGYFQKIIHSFDYTSLAVAVSQYNGDQELPPVVVVFAACGAVATPIPTNEPRPAWKYCTRPQCWQQPANTAPAEPIDADEIGKQPKR